MKILCLIGKKCSGKGTFAKILVSKGIKVYEMSSFIYCEMKKRKMAITKDNIRPFSTELRKKKGRNIVARLAWKKISKECKKNKLVVVDGIRSMHEVNFLKKHAETKLLLVKSNNKLRFKRLLFRKREGDPKTMKEFNEIEKVHYSWGMESAMKKADITVRNNSTKKELVKKAEKIIKMLLK